MKRKAQDAAKELLNREWKNLHEAEKRVLDKFIARETISRNIGTESITKRTFGEKVADQVAAFGGSWTFIIIFCAILLFWVALNTFILLNRAFDPYPYILLNLFLSMTAALQAPIIMMSQNRQAAKDRLDAAHDYEVNLKAELEIVELHRKIDDLREQKWLELIEMQQRQLEILENLHTIQKT